MDCCALFYTSSSLADSMRLTFPGNQLCLWFVSWALAHSVIYAQCWNKYNADKVWTTWVNTPSVLLNIDKRKMDKETWHIVLYWFSCSPAMSSIVLWLESFSDSNEWCSNPAKYMTSNETQLKVNLFFSFLQRAIHFLKDMAMFCNNICISILRVV